MSSGGSGGLASRWWSMGLAYDHDCLELDDALGDGPVQTDDVGSVRLHAIDVPVSRAVRLKGERAAIGAAGSRRLLDGFRVTGNVRLAARGREREHPNESNQSRSSVESTLSWKSSMFFMLFLKKPE